MFTKTQPKKDIAECNFTYEPTIAKDGYFI